jgi:hypothetical protein
MKQAERFGARAGVMIASNAIYRSCYSFKEPYDKNCAWFSDETVHKTEYFAATYEADSTLDLQGK